jgi:hypothetical protein
MVGKLKRIIWLVNQARGMKQRIEKPDREYEPVSHVKISNNISYPHVSTHVTITLLYAVTPLIVTTKGPSWS